MNLLYYSTYTIDEGRDLSARFADQNARDGFEISIGMYRANLGAITEEVFRQYVERFQGEVLEA